MNGHGSAGRRDDEAGSARRPDDGAGSAPTGRAARARRAGDGSPRRRPPAALVARVALAGCLALGAVPPLPAQTAGVLAGGAETLEPLTLSVVEPLAEGPYILESGGYYEIDIVCDGSAELALSGPEFFRNIWIDEVVVNDIEVRALGLDSLEFDDEGTATIKFVAIRPGAYVVRIPGTSGESQRAEFEIR